MKDMQPATLGGDVVAPMTPTGSVACDYEAEWERSIIERLQLLERGSRCYQNMIGHGAIEWRVLPSM